MIIKDFQLERYFARHEFESPYLLCCSDCESFAVNEILGPGGGSALESFLDMRLGYTESRGNPALRQHIADLYRKISPDDVLVTAGAEEAIFIFMNAVLKPGDHVIVQYPCYQSLFEIAQSIGCTVTPWKCNEKKAWDPDLDYLERSIKKNTRAIIINSPHNPTGHLMPALMLGELIDLARSRDILLFSDEVYRFLEYNSADRGEAACDLYENAFSLGVMSKSYGLAGLRIGWISTKNRSVYNKMASFKDYTSICSSAPSEFLAICALRQGDRLIQRNLGIIKKNLELLDSFFDRYKHLFHWQKPKAGPIAFPSIKWDRDVENFCLDLLQSKGVLLLPGNYYNYGQRHFRIGFGRRNLPECIEKLEEYLAEKKADPRNL